MKYRLMFRSDLENGASEVVLTQKMNRFDPALPAVINIKAVLQEGALLAQALLADELEVEFQKREITKIGGFEMKELVDLEKGLTVNFNFLSAEKSGFDVLEAEFID